jgi:hypothetical protein
VRNITEAWGEWFEEDSGQRAVGMVGGTSIKRIVIIFRRASASDDEELT